jgi:malate dehydrogenase (oxaloacetate-decarboxylating)(NADP+)
MEGKGCLFKKFAGIDVFDIELSESDLDKLVEAIAMLEPTLGGINPKASCRELCSPARSN